MSINIPYDQIIACQNFFFRSMAASCFEREGILACSMGIDNSFLNCVLETTLPQDKLNDTIPDIENFFAEQNVPWTWLVLPTSTIGLGNTLVQCEALHMVAGSQYAY